MGRTRICFVGGGSYQWTPKLLTDIALTNDPAGTEFRIETSDNLAEALRDAEFVIVTITTGGLEAMRKDLDIPLRYGIYQSVGDTVGPGGWSRALRNVPVMVNIAKTMEKVCPN